MRWIIYLSRRCIDYTHQVALWDFMFGSRLDGTGWNPTTLGFLLDDKPGTSSESDDAAQRSRSPKFHGGSEPAVGDITSLQGSFPRRTHAAILQIYGFNASISRTRRCIQ
ncbi:hypothetical protein ED733_000260 [Metarhizium rileyi]|uniref:Uncharacterized protein n=1 Tax=Metarhizium rileyi (strain RCEF 4871) TaxID=1649241 RepID=A0A5C6G1Q8_METRR|nr:hypothetical protein ED733_000260 [Metarhizium rileyi]